MRLYLDVETYSSIDIASCGAYKYCESPDFEILLLAYAVDDGPVGIFDLTEEHIPSFLKNYLESPIVTKCAHNAAFERAAFKAIGFNIPIEQWECSMVKSAYCGLPLALDQVSEALSLGDKSKLAAGKTLIRKFCIPVKPTIKNGHKYRTMPEDDPDSWEQFKKYCQMDVEAERAVFEKLSAYRIPDQETHLYQVDGHINDRGIGVDVQMASNASDFNDKYKDSLLSRTKQLTGVNNPNSATQIRQWLAEAMQKEIKSLAKDAVSNLLVESDSASVTEVLTLRAQSAKSSAKKYNAMLNCECYDGRARGLIQFYGAGRTGRWSGRLIQVQNLPKNVLEGKALEIARQLVADGNYSSFISTYDNPATVLSELIRTAFIAKRGHIFAICDFSSIEARVIAWLAGEKWRLDVFSTHGKIYEASAAAMFGLNIDDIKKGSKERDKGKVAELALGYQGGKGALAKMGAEKMGLSEIEMEIIVNKWREASPNIVLLWERMQKAALAALKNPNRRVRPLDNISFLFDGKALRMILPSGRELIYWDPRIRVNKWGGDSIAYMGMNQETKKWGLIDTYGGKFTENAVQAIARDLLAVVILDLDQMKIPIVMHVHDEVICEVPEKDAEDVLRTLENIMSVTPFWATGLPLDADGHITHYYKKPDIIPQKTLA